MLARIRSDARAEAADRRSIDTGSVFYQRLVNHYLVEYLANPCPETGERAVEKIGARRDGGVAPMDSGIGDPSLGFLRELLPGLPEDLRPADGVLSDENLEAMPYIDAPHLLGAPNLRRGIMDDVQYGGRNWSHTMQWATGVRQSSASEETLRELFLASEMFHLEHWDIFGEDPINDLIAKDSGQKLGRELRAGSIDRENLRAKLDEAFAESRAWVGSLLRVRRAELDRWLLARRPIPANTWWGEWQPAVPPQFDYTIYGALEGGTSFEEVLSSGLVKSATGIYALIYESDAWQAKHGKFQDSALIRGMLEGNFDWLFAAAKRPAAPESPGEESATAGSGSEPAPKNAAP